MTNICSDNLAESRDFYTKLFDFKVGFDSDWFIQLVSDGNGLELGIIDRTNELVPKDFQNNPQGFYITFVVEDVDATYAIAKEENFKVIKAPEDTFYGQRRLLLEDPDGTLVDVSAPIPNFKFQ